MNPDKDVVFEALVCVISMLGIAIVVIANWGN